ncbi:hypothetical protein FD13_GL002011 [Levilactobacillus senmaizukei DSM 21775 = NBRC 103853]|uniref:HTH hxlR-type domain-containing protein n=1 Tax=Levilactobacillus senmaizukei DSM 21775 = NBRC 103853 TaxID=1423803 RepID=A0A0R2DH46_9LACO|nr:hypothetical protein [Levilactobacillus senmaizukei]KRN02331.1 hypothetical protein FD13_GL002011 [Levilactobacillus senmaizukei DSM 21775 = NBRC 103853]
METQIRGLKTTQSMVNHPVEWRLMLALLAGPRTLSQLRQPFHGWQWWQAYPRLWRLQQRQLVVVDHQHHLWRLTAAGESLSPVLTALATCMASQKEGITDEV